MVIPNAAPSQTDKRIEPADAGFGVYIHWPFCLSKCPYCDFNSHVFDAVPEARWRDAIRAEIGHYAAATPGRTVTSIFFGGGTPSLMSPETAAAVIETVRRAWSPALDMEITLEANPTSVEAGKMRAFRAAGVNRASLGVQALDDDALRFLGRHHSVKDAMQALDAAAAAFERFSLDLIYARPGQTAAAWRDELNQALARAGEHLSLYQLTIEPGTRFFRERIAAADEDTGAEMYNATQEAMAAAGLPAYEISNHARPGAECRHNLTYWRGGDYIGVGPGAHGRITRAGTADALYQIHDPGRWLAAVEQAGHGTAKRTALTAAERAEELLLSGLRLAEGINRARFARLTGRPIETAISTERLSDLIDAGFLIFDGFALRATPPGRLRLNAVISALIA